MALAARRAACCAGGSRRASSRRSSSSSCRARRVLAPVPRSTTSCRARRVLAPVPRALGASGGSHPEASLEERFATELATREQAAAQAAESAAAAGFNGEQLLRLVRAKYGRAYDVSLVQRTVMGKHFVALNIMWRYMEQQSFGLSRDQFMARLDYVAAALVDWGVVSTVQAQVAATKERPRVGKAVSILLSGVDEAQARAWIAR